MPVVWKLGGPRYRALGCSREDLSVLDGEKDSRLGVPRPCLPIIFNPINREGGGSTAELVSAALAVTSGRGSSEIGRATRFRPYCPSCHGRFSSRLRLVFHRCTFTTKGSL